jgi:hypothetical protein
LFESYVGLIVFVVEGSGEAIWRRVTVVVRHQGLDLDFYVLMVMNEVVKVFGVWVTL